MSFWNLLQCVCIYIYIYIYIKVVTLDGNQMALRALYQKGILPTIPRDAIDGLCLQANTQLKNNLFYQALN